MICSISLAQSLSLPLNQKSFPSPIDRPSKFKRDAAGLFSESVAKGKVCGDANDESSLHPSVRHFEGHLEADLRVPCEPNLSLRQRMRARAGSGRRPRRGRGGVKPEIHIDGLPADNRHSLWLLLVTTRGGGEQRGARKNV